LFLAKDFLISVYNLLEERSAYRSDLIDLFGTADAAKKGFIGGRSFDKSLRWDWGDPGFKGIISILYFLSGKQPDKFREFYYSNVFHKTDILHVLIDNKVIDNKPLMLYVISQKSKKIPAFTSEIEEISWEKNEEGKWRIWWVFKPKGYLLLDWMFWKENVLNVLLEKGRENPTSWFDNWERLWDIPRFAEQQITQMLKPSVSQAQYHIVPLKLLQEEVKQKVDPYKSQQKGAVFIKNVSRNDQRLQSGNSTDNQSFWGILSEIIGKTQVRGKVEFTFCRNHYSITDIPSNTTSEGTWVFKQEIGAARTICQALVDTFGQEYVDLEFGRERTINLVKSKFLRRASKVSEVASQFESDYAETDFDYELSFKELSIKYPCLKTKLLFDLTAGLWNKDRTTSHEDFVRQWEHNLIRVPERNSNICVIWHYGLNSKTKDGSYKQKEIGDYLKAQTQMNTVKYQPDTITSQMSLPGLVLMPFFTDSPVNLEQELNRISSEKAAERRKSMLYNALKEILTKMIT
jgi:hypothetical protein